MIFGSLRYSTFHCLSDGENEAENLRSPVQALIDTHILVRRLNKEEGVDEHSTGMMLLWMKQTVILCEQDCSQFKATKNDFFIRIQLGISHFIKILTFEI